MHSGHQKRHHVVDDTNRKLRVPWVAGHGNKPECVGIERTDANMRRRDSGPVVYVGSSPGVCYVLADASCNESDNCGPAPGTQ